MRGRTASRRSCPGDSPRFPTEELEAFVNASTEPSLAALVALMRTHPVLIHPITALSELFCAEQRDLRNVARGAGPAIAGVARHSSATVDLSLDARALRRVLRAEMRALKRGRKTTPAENASEITAVIPLLDSLQLTG